MQHPIFTSESPQFIITSPNPPTFLMRSIVHHALSLQIQATSVKFAHSRNQRGIRKEAQCINKDPDPSGLFHLLSEYQGMFGLSSHPFSLIKGSRASGWRSKASLAISCQRGSFPSSFVSLYFYPRSSSLQLNEDNENFENRYYLCQRCPQMAAFLYGKGSFFMALSTNFWKSEGEMKEKHIAPSFFIRVCSLLL